MKQEPVPSPRIGGAVTAAPLALLRLEGFAVCLAALILYGQSHASWLLFSALFLAPDLSMLFYLLGPRIGAAGYNAVHVYLLPLGLAAFSWFSGWSLGLPLALIWLAHIGLDRMLGYGLKYPDGFKFTHLGRIGG
jgi:hypothetical protein